ncbi:Bbp16 family capsid cement protein [Sphaerochaeta globosa]|uniref:Uncharacterized protein n=1 Tax=Sphaerochaeta globosa (strain ATCC BAA-1886 / DSM 22777 / Buddy) TaxID=158189 RepID=F0RWQ4_SPHGB|nr:hypothetical protein [Sphaerochaeta globosa]ADY13685.1 hypothetical protein SpiBuddy_1861 [Sphaerochaeta globosa str. Buddy]
MLYEKKRTFGREPIDLTAAALAKDAVVFVGQAVSATAGTAETLDYEADNQHFPEENTLEVIGWETAASVGKAATLTLTLQSSKDALSWKDEVAFTLAEADIVKDSLVRRFSIPAQAGRHMRLKAVVGTEVFTAGKVLALVRPL